MNQLVLTGPDKYIELHKWISGKRVLVVCDQSYPYIKKVKSIIDGCKDITIFNDFVSNPVYDSVVKGVDVYDKNLCNAIIAVGGGSAIDVAKCIKLYSGLDTNKLFFDQTIIDNHIPLLVIPTTAGTGSEATRYAVIYYKGEKQSITNSMCLPDVVILDADNLKSLPMYQRKATMLDTLSHALESAWSINSSEKSMEYSLEAIHLFNEFREGYLNNTNEGNAGMQKAAYIAGRAINITQTTAGHAMSYKITSLFGCAHGHATALCNRKLIPWMLNHLDNCVDARGKSFLQDTFSRIAEELKLDNSMQLINWIDELYDSLEMDVPRPNNKQLIELSHTINVERLKNHPIRLSENDIYALYNDIFK